jgi:hypothetical protein
MPTCLFRFSLILAFLPNNLCASFDLLPYDLGNSKKIPVHTRAEKKKIEEWKPGRKLTPEEGHKLVGILEKRFGKAIVVQNNPMECSYTWRFEGEQYLVLGVHRCQGSWTNCVHELLSWDWCDPRFAIFDHETRHFFMKYPPCEIDDIKVPPAQIFETFKPHAETCAELHGGADYRWMFSEFRVVNDVTYPNYRCLSKWQSDSFGYYISTKTPTDDEVNIGADGKTPIRVGFLRFAKLSAGLYMCFCAHYVEGSMGAEEDSFVFEVYEDTTEFYGKRKKETRVRYLGRRGLDGIEKFVADWDARKRGVRRDMGQRNESFYGYYSKDGKIAIEYPRNKDPWEDPKDGTWYTPVVIHRYGDTESIETNMCTVVDSGSCGNYALESKDKSVRLEDYSFCNSGDPEAIYTSVTFKKNGRTEMIPLERRGMLELDSE